MMSADEQMCLSELLAKNSEGRLAENERGQLDSLMKTYRMGRFRKAEAWKVAAERGLRAVVG